MENIREFLINNYVYILIVIILLIITVIGFLVDRNKTEKKKKKEEGTPLPAESVANQTTMVANQQMQPVTSPPVQENISNQEIAPQSINNGMLANPMVNTLVAENTMTQPLNTANQQVNVTSPMMSNPNGGIAQVLNTPVNNENSVNITTPIDITNASGNTPVQMMDAPNVTTQQSLNAPTINQSNDNISSVFGAPEVAIPVQEQPIVVNPVQQTQPIQPINEVPQVVQQSVPQPINPINIPTQDNSKYVPLEEQKPIIAPRETNPYGQLTQSQKINDWNTNSGIQQNQNIQPNIGNAQVQPIENTMGQVINNSPVNFVYGPQNNNMNNQ